MDQIELKQKSRREDYGYQKIRTMERVKMVHPAQLFLTQYQSRFLKFLNNIVGGYNSQIPKVCMSVELRRSFFLRLLLLSPLERFLLSTHLPLSITYNNIRNKVIFNCLTLQSK